MIIYQQSPVSNGGILIFADYLYLVLQINKI